MKRALLSALFFTAILVGCDGPGAEQQTTATTAETLSLPDQARPFEGIITAGQPTKEQFAQLSHQGVDAVLNLRPADELTEWDEMVLAEQQGLAYANIPISGPEDLNREKVQKFDAALQDLSEEGTVLVHCSSSNRVGALFALRANWIERKTPEEALEIGKKAGLDTLQPAVEERFDPIYE